MELILTRLDAVPIIAYVAACVAVLATTTLLLRLHRAATLRNNIRANSAVQRWRWTENRWFVDTTTPRGK